MRNAIKLHNAFLGVYEQRLHFIVWRWIPGLIAVPCVIAIIINPVSPNLSLHTADILSCSAVLGSQDTRTSGPIEPPYVVHIH